MMRGVVARGRSRVRKPAARASSTRRERASQPRRGRSRRTARSRSTSIPAHLGPQDAPLLRLPIIRGVVALGESLAIGFKALGISANAQLPEEEEEISGGMWVGTVVVALVLAVGLFFVVPVGAHEPDQGPARLVVPVLARRGRAAHRDLPRLPAAALARCATCAASSSTTAPSTRRSPATRPGWSSTPENAQRFSRLHPRCGTSFLLIVMIVAIFVFAPIGLPAWYWLVADAHRRRAADRRHLVRDHQVRRQQPPPALGARDHVPGHAAAEADHARARPRPARRRDRRAWRRCSRSRTRAR